MSNEDFENKKINEMDGKEISERSLIEIELLHKQNFYLQKKIQQQKKEVKPDIFKVIGAISFLCFLVWISYGVLPEITEVINNIEVPYILVILGFYLSKELNRNNLIIEFEKEYYYNCLEIEKVDVLNDEESKFMKLVMSKDTKK